MEVTGRIAAGTEKVKKQTMDKLCEPCQTVNKNSEATVICFQCEEYMCLGCFKEHLKAKPCRKHEFLETNRFSMSFVKSVLRVYDVEKCKQHGNETIKFYCGKHDVVGCGECMLMGGHRPCEHEYIRDLGKDFQSSKDFGRLMRRIENMELKNQENMTLINEMMECNTEMKEQAATDIKSFITDLRGLLDTTEKRLLSGADKLHTKIQITMNAMKVMCKSTGYNLDSVKKRVNTDHYQGNALFINAVNCKQTLLKVGQTLSDVEKKKQINSFSFQPNEAFLGQMKATNAVGTLQVTTSLQDEKCSSRRGDIDRGRAIRGIKVSESGDYGSSDIRGDTLHAQDTSPGNQESQQTANYTQTKRASKSHAGLNWDS